MCLVYVCLGLTLIRLIQAMVVHALEEGRVMKLWQVADALLIVLSAFFVFSWLFNTQGTCTVL
jgi:protein-S-isoprenylcysteine O-methyltransferase Ste14